MSKKLTSFFLISTLLLSQSCATIFNGGSQAIVANASGDEENVAVQVVTPNGAYKSRLPSTIVTTPSTFNETQVFVKDKCYEETTMTVGKSVTPSFWVNFLWGFGFPVAMLIDCLDGYMWKVDQQVVVPLNPNGKCKA